MNLLDVAIGVLVAAAAAAALISIRRRKKSGKGCCGDCAHCTGACRQEKKPPADTLG